MGVDLMVVDPQFQAPASEREARARLVELLDRRNALEAELGTNDRRGPNGKRLTPTQWEVWRAETKRDLRHATADYRALKQWVFDTYGPGGESRDIRLAFDALRYMADVLKQAEAVAADPSAGNVNGLCALVRGRET